MPVGLVAKGRLACEVRLSRAGRIRDRQARQTGKAGKTGRQMRDRKAYKEDKEGNTNSHAEISAS